MFFLSIKIALKTLARHKMRTFLTVLGVVVGISAVIIIFSAGESVKAYFTSQLDIFGSNWIEIEIKVPNTGHVSTENAMGQAQGISITTLKNSDVEAVGKLPNIKDVYGGVTGQELVSYQETNKRILLFGASASIANIDKSNLEAGRWYTLEEEKSLANVAVLGWEVKQDLFGDSDPLGKEIKIKNSKFKVIGVVEKKGATLGMSMDTFIFVPLETLQKEIMGIDHILFMIAEPIDTSKLDETTAAMTDLMRQRHEVTDPNKDDFAVITMKETQDIINNVFSGVTLLLTALVALSLIVGGVGIINIMYVSVTERTYEIGLRKALGATQSNILWQFLWEAIFITFLGGILGIVFGIGALNIISLTAASLGFEWPLVIPLKAVILACSFSITFGIIFGYYPARKAAKLEPVDALRYE